jgi:hypothetical protein
MYSSTVVQAESVNDTGSLSFTIAGHEIRGQLLNSTLSPNSVVTMSMNVDYAANTSLGQLTMKGSGNWYGKANGTSLQGVIYGVKGSVQICYVFYCGTALYVGYGIWNGAFRNSTFATGTLQAVVIFTNSQIANIPLDRPMLISGTWNSTMLAES